MTDRDPISSVSSGLALAPPPPAAPGSPSARGSKVWHDGDTTSFRDILAILNPLQHIPIVSTIYRAVTGDSIGVMPSIIGGTLYGGAIGLALSLANGAFKAETGHDAGETVMASLFGPGSPPAIDAPTDLVAEAPAAAPAQIAALPPLPPAPNPGVPSPGVKDPPFASVPVGAKNPLGTRFRSTDLPQPAAEGGGLKSHTASDLVPTAAGTAISRDAVPAAMASALEKYGAMMRARNLAQLPARVSMQS